MPGINYAKFDRLVAEDEAEDRLEEEQRKQADEERTKRDLEARRMRELDALRKAEDEWRRGSGIATSASTATEVPGSGLPLSSMKPVVQKPEAEARVDPRVDVAKSAVRSKAAGLEFDKLSKEDIENIDVDDFFRPLNEDEKAERQRLKAEKMERRRLMDEAAGRHPLRDVELSPEEITVRIQKLKADRLEMKLLMDRSDRPAVKARLGEFVLDLDNELARLREDPLELDDEDRRELRLFHLRKMQLPGAARAQREFSTQTACAPRPLAPGECALAPPQREEPWQEITSFVLDLGEASPSVTVDVRIEAVERLPEGAVSCHFTPDSFDLQVVHGLQGRRYRLLRNCLQRDIDAQRSSFRVKRNHIVVSLAKLQEDLLPDDNIGVAPTYQLWTDLCAPNWHSRNMPAQPLRPVAEEPPSTARGLAPA